MTMPVKAWFEFEGKVLRARLNRPPANILDEEMVTALDGVLAEHLDNTSLSAVMIDADGSNFSYGASVEEHLPQQCASMLHRFHDLLLRIVESDLPIIAAVKGRCFGGGLELAMAAHLCFVAADANLAQPEMKLGVFAPAASCILPKLIGPTRAYDLLVSGRTITGTEACQFGIANAAADDPEQAALTYIREHIIPKSSSSVRFATVAARGDFARTIRPELKRLEAIYLENLMKTHDAVEGLQAFLQKREAQWMHR